MKRFLSAILIVMMTVALPVEAAAAGSGGYKMPQGTTAFTLKAGGFAADPVRFQTTEALEALRELLSQAGTPAQKPAAANELARVVTEQSDGTRTYILQQSGSRYYLLRGKACRVMDYGVFQEFVGKMEELYGAGIRFSVKGGDTHLGEVVVLHVAGAGADAPLATFTSDITLNLPPRFFRQADGSQIALFPVSYFNAAGQHWVEIQYGGESARYTINAKDKQWQRQDLDVSDSTAEETINSQKANAEYEQVIGPLRSVMDDAKHWSGRFILPVSDEKVTTQFGMVRYVNGQPTSTRHGALDLAVPRGTPVKAAGSGRVLYAGFLQLTGNTVLIEHGYGLKSWYYHMDSLSVKTGEMVRQGGAVGTVGSTGFSTGPHLHFGMSVNNVFINPYTAIQTDLLT